MIDVREIRHFHLFSGLGGGAKGFNKAQPRVGNMVGRYRCIGGVDVDAGALRDFERLTGMRGTVLDLFDRDQYIAFNGHEPPADWREATPADIRAAAGGEYPHIVFLSAPCKGFSGLMSETRSRTDRYQALNRLTERGIWLMLEAFADDPPELVVFENVPRIMHRGRQLLDRIDSMLHAYTYATAETTHDCGRLGNLAQSRKRYLKVARHTGKVRPFVYEPHQRPLRAVGDILGRVAHLPQVRHFVELTGTPSPNGLKDLWGQVWFLDRGQRLGRTYDAFKSRWFQTVQVGADPHAIDLVPLPHAQREIEDLLRDLCISLDPADWFDLREPICVPVYFDLPDRARDLYQDMERQMFAQIDGHDVEAFNAAARTIKCLQLANGAAYTTDDQGDNRPWAEVHDLKLQALESIVEESGGAPLLVAYHFKPDLARLLKAFPKGRHLDTDPQTLRDFKAGRIPLLFAHPDSAGHGLDGMQDVCNAVAFFGHWWNLETRQQIIERVGAVRQAQAGHDRPTYIYDIIARGTVDEIVMARHETKREVQDLLLEAMKARRY